MDRTRRPPVPGVPARERSRDRRRQPRQGSGRVRERGHHRLPARPRRVTPASLALDACIAAIKDAGITAERHQRPRRCEPAVHPVVARHPAPHVLERCRHPVRLRDRERDERGLHRRRRRGARVPLRVPQPDVLALGSQRPVPTHGLSGGAGGGAGRRRRLRSRQHQRRGGVHRVGESVPLRVPRVTRDVRLHRDQRSHERGAEPGRGASRSAHDGRLPRGADDPVAAVPPRHGRAGRRRRRVHRDHGRAGTRHGAAAGA